VATERNQPGKNRSRRGRGEGAVYQRGDGLWTASVSLGYDGDGKRKRRTVYDKTKAEVAKKLRKLQTSVDAGRVPETSALTLGQFLDLWLEAVKPTVASYTYLAYERDCRLYLKPHLGGVRLVTLGVLHVQKLYSDLAKAGISAAMQRKAGVTLGVALQYAVEALKVVPHNVARDVKKPRHTPAEMQVLDPHQVQQFLAEAHKDRLAALYVFLLDSGAREGEAFGLKWPDVDWAGEAVQIVRELEEVKGALSLKDLKTKKSRRRVKLTPFAMAALADHRKAMLADGHDVTEGPVFCDTQGGWLRKSNVLRRSFRPILKRANLPPIRPYDLRHSSATLLLLAGEDSKVVAERLGHSSTRLTQDTYQHVLPGMQERAAAKLDAIFRQDAKEQKSAS
jgi:integrase